jgi:hypothetical protein
MVLLAEGEGGGGLANPNYSKISPHMSILILVTRSVL